MAWVRDEIGRRWPLLNEPMPPPHRCGAFCRALGLQFAHEVRRTGREVAEMVERMRRGDTLTGL